MDVKLRKVTAFIEDGNKVRLSVVFRGREMAHKELGFKLMDKILEKLSLISVVDQNPQFAGRQISAVVRSNNAKVKNP
jgi:translation initiation factor IF-3